MTQKFMLTLFFLGLSSLASSVNARAQILHPHHQNLIVQGSYEEPSYETKNLIINFVRSNAVSLCTLIQLCTLTSYEDILTALVDAIIDLNPAFAPFRNFIEGFLLKDGIDFIITECNCPS